MKIFFTFLFGFLFLVPAWAQPPGGGNRPEGGPPQITGRIVDDSGEGLPYASMELFVKEGKISRKATATDFDGNFVLRARPGTYILEIYFLSYEKLSIDPIELTREGLELGNIVLKSTGVDLEEVVVQAEKSQMELKLDKKVFTVGKDLGNSGGSAVELLENVPSVDVDVEGNVSLRGSGNVRILLNGKPSGIIGLGDQKGLNTIQSNMIESIELITNPSAKYDAEGEVGIINIILKKEKQKGINGSYNLTVGYPENFGVGINMNLRREKVNFFTNFGVNYRNGPGGGTLYQENFPGTDSVNIYQSTRTHSRGGLSGNVQFGADFYLNKYNTITASGMYKLSDGLNKAEILYEDLDANKNVVSSTLRTDREEEPGTDIEFSANYTKKFKQKKRELSVDVKFDLNDDLELSDFVETVQETGAFINQRSSNLEAQQNFLFQADYFHPIGKEGKFETGLKMELREIDNDFQVEEQNEENEWIAIGGFDDQMLYTENIYAAYAIYGNKLGKLSYQGGLRMEHSQIETYLVETDLRNPREYTNLFPSAHVSYEINKKNQLQLGYSRRINRPRFRHLLPFATFSDVRNLWRGNPDLNPEFTDSYEFGHLLFFDKGSLLSNVYYRHSTGVINRVNVPSDDGTVTRMPINLSESQSIGFEFSLNYDLTKWWSLNGNLNIFNQETEGEFEGVVLSANTNTASFNGSMKFKLPQQISLQTSLRYRAPRETTQGSRKGMAVANFGASKKILKNKGTLTFSVRDAFNTGKRISTVDLPTLYSESEFQWRVRAFTLTFNYRLNQDKGRGGKGEQRGGRPSNSSGGGGGDDF